MCGQLAAHKIYRQDIISVGLDIYNVEAEALGAQVSYYSDDRLPPLTGRPVRDAAGLDWLRPPDPSRGGRQHIGYAHGSRS